MGATERIVVMAIRPHLAALIYSGDKRFEYRRQSSRLSTGDWVLVYETGPISRITGMFRIGRVFASSSDTLLALEASSKVKLLVQEYLAGARAATAFEIRCPTRWSRQPRVYEIDPRYRHPQSYFYI